MDVETLAELLREVLTDKSRTTPSRDEKYRNGWDPKDTSPSMAVTDDRRTVRGVHPHFVG